MAFDADLTMTSPPETLLSVLKISQSRLAGSVHISSPAISWSNLADLIISNSSLGSRMSYNRVSYADLNLPINRKRRSFLDSRYSVRLFDLPLSQSADIILSKVKLLDQFLSI